MNVENQDVPPLTLEAFSAELKAASDALVVHVVSFKRVIEDLAEKVDEAPSSFPKHMACADLAHQLARVGRAFEE